MRIRRFLLQGLYDEIESYEQKNLVLSESFQKYCQMIPPCIERDDRKRMIRDLRSRQMKLRLRVLEQREIYRLAVPLLCRYNEHSLKIKPWLDEVEARSRTFIDKLDDDIILLEHGDDAEVRIFPQFMRLIIS